MIVKLFSIVSRVIFTSYNIHVALLPLYGRYIKVEFLPNHISARLCCQQNRHSRLLSAVSKRTNVSCDSHSDLKYVMPRPASLLYAELYTYASCDWINPENLWDLTQPGDPVGEPWRTHDGWIYRDLVAELSAIFNVNNVAHLHQHVQLFDNLIVQ